MSLFSTFFDVVGSITDKNAAKRSRNLEKDTLKLEKEGNEERIRRREYEQAQTYGTAKAYANASGIEINVRGSTAERFLNEMSTEFTKEIDWMNEWADESFRLGIKGADDKYRARRTGAYTEAASSIFDFGAETADDGFSWI